MGGCFSIGKSTRKAPQPPAGRAALSNQETVQSSPQRHTESSLSSLRRRTPPLESSATSLRASLPRSHGNWSQSEAGTSKARDSQTAKISSYIDQLKELNASGKQASVAQEDAHWQPQMIAVQNQRVPNLNLQTFDLSDSNFSGFQQAVASTPPGARWRALVNIDRGFGEGIPKHVVAVEVEGRKKSPSVVAIDSLWACAETQRVLPKALQNTGASLKLVNTEMQKGPVGCAVFALEVAKEMANSERFLGKLHKSNGKDEEVNEHGVKFGVENGKTLLPANFFKHTTSQRVFDELPVGSRQKLKGHFEAHLTQREDAKGKIITYSNSLEEVRIQMMEDVLRAAEA